MPTYKTLTDIDFFRKTALVRIDANFDVSPNSSTDNVIALEATRATITHITKAGGRVVLLGHRGHPAGKPNADLSLRPLATALTNHLGKDVNFTPDCIGRSAEQAIADTPFGDILLLENTRFHQGDELNDATFARHLAANADVFVFDALTTAHFSHASTLGVMQNLPSVLGAHAADTLKTIDAALNTPQKPLLAIVGGAKMSSRAEVLKHLVLKADMLLLGGGVANTFLEAKDFNMGHSLVEPAYIEPARDILAEAGIVGCRILLPQDAVTAPENVSNAPATTKLIHTVEDQDVVLDIGKATSKTWAKVIKDAGTVIWLGTVGVHENNPFHKGSHAIAEALAASDATSIVSGTDTARCLIASGQAEYMTCTTTADHALLALLSEKPLPALEPLLRH